MAELADGVISIIDETDLVPDAGMAGLLYQHSLRFTKFGILLCL